MTSRVISYTFRGDFGNLRAGLTGAAKETDATKLKLKELEAQAKKSQANLQGFKGGILNSLGLGAGAGPQAFGLAAAAGITAIVTTTAKFDQAMSAVQAATHETTGNMEALRKAAIKAGADTVFSATESANAIEAMAKAGVSTKDILSGGLKGALNLAAAGTIDVANAADIAATTLNQFNLSGDQTSHVADVLSAAAGKAQGEVTDMAQALKYVGPVAAQMGVSLEETTGAIAELATKGILADQAGTSLRGMLTALTSPSKIAATQMQALGINVYDAQGKFVGFRGIAGQLQSTMSGLTNAERDQALGRIFGNEQITAARILYAGGAADVDKWTNAVNDSGYASETASIKLDNLAGDWEQLKGAIQSATIESGEGSQGPLRNLTQAATDLVNGWNNLPGAVKQSTSGLAGNWDLITGGLDKIGIHIGQNKKAAKDATPTNETYAGSLGSIAPVADDGAKAIADMSKAMQDQRKAALSSFDAVTQYGQALDDAQAQAKKSNAGINASTDAGRKNRAALSSLAAAWNNQSDAVRNNSAKFRQARRDFIDTATAMGVPIGTARRLAKSLLDIPDSKAVTVTVEASSAQATLASIIRQAQSVPRVVRTDYIVNQINAGNKRAAGRADGGPVIGPGSGTSDDVPIWASNGEFVMKTAAVQKYGPAMMHSINSLAFANGGMVGYAGGGQVRSYRADGVTDIRDFLNGVKLGAASLKQLKSAIDKSKSAIDDERQKRNDLRSSIASNVSGAYQHDIFGNGLSGAMTQLKADTNDTNAAKRGLGLAVKHGLNAHGALYQALAASGDTNTIGQLSHASAAQVKAFEAAYNRRASVTAGFGNSVAGQDRNVIRMSKDLQRLNQIQDRLEKTVRNLHHAVHDGAAKGVSDGMQKRNQNTSQRVRAGR